MADSKYHQVAVPDHPGGSSFLRLGSFPSGGDPAPLPAGFEKARALAGVSAARATTSGHWSHTDGNRITTTVGNVVDVINGSYIAVRSAAASPPGPALTASWSSWSYTQTGSVDYPVGGGGSGGDPTGSQPDSFQITYGQTGGATDSTTADGKASNGDVITATWAGRSMTYVGSASKPVPYVFTQTYGGKVATYTYTTVANETLTTATGGSVSTTTKITGGGSSNTTTTVTGGDINTTSTVDGGSAVTKTTVSGGDSSTITNVTGGKVLTSTEADAITTTQTAPAITNVNTAANTLNFTFGIVENVTVGPAVLNLTAAAGIANLSFGAQTSVDLPESLQFEGIKTVASIEETKATALAQRFAGLKDEINGAFTRIAGAVTKLHDTQVAIGSGDYELYAGHVRLGMDSANLSAAILLGV